MVRKLLDYFLSRDAMHKRGLCCRLVSVSCLSVTFVYCIQTARDIVKLLSRPSSPIILVFLIPSAGTQFQGERTPSAGALNTWVGKIAVYLGSG